MKASTVLSKARKLIANTGHTKGELARNKYRHAVDPTSPNAVKFCAYGAIQNVMGIKDSPTMNPDLQKVTDVSKFLGATIPVACGSGWWSVDDYNDRDEVTQKDIDNWFRRAITLAKRSEKASY